MKSRCFEPSGHVLHSPSLPLRLLPCWFSPSAEQQGGFSRCNRGPRQKVRACHSVKSEFCGSSVFILFCSAILVVLRVPKPGVLCTTSLHRRRLKLRKCARKTKNVWCSRVRGKKCPPPSARTLTGKGEMRERPWKLDKAGQKETDIFSTRLFL